MLMCLGNSWMKPVCCEFFPRVWDGGMEVQVHGEFDNLRVMVAMVAMVENLRV